MRVLSSTALQALMAQETDQAFLVLITLSHPSLAQPIYVTSDAVNTVSGGNTFFPFPFIVQLPDDRADQVQQGTLTIDATDLSIITALRSIGNTPPTITIQIVLAATPNTIEMQLSPLTLRDVTYDDQQVTGRLTFEEILSEAFPADEVTPSTIPGAFSVSVSS